MSLIESMIPTIWYLSWFSITSIQDRQCVPPPNKNIFGIFQLVDDIVSFILVQTVQILQYLLKETHL